MELKAGQKPIRLHYNAAEQRVVVMPEDENNFCMSVEEAISACRDRMKYSSFHSKFKQLLGTLAAWVDRHSEAIDKAVITLRDGSILFMVVNRTASYDRELEDDLTDLDLKIARDDALRAIRLDVMVLPNCDEEALKAFIDPELYLVYGH